MLDKQRIFDDCVAKHLGPCEQWDLATATMLCDAFVCMRRQLESANASGEDRSAFMEVIEQGIKNDPVLALQRFENDRAELQKVVRSAFFGGSCEANFAPKVGFLNTLRF